MTDPDDVSEDRGFKALFTSYPVETITVFAPELLAEHGQPSRVEAIQQEQPLPDLGDPSRFLDVALLATWDDGSQTVILLVEHWSTARRIDLRRVHWYYAALSLQHPEATVFPVILVTEKTAQALTSRLQSVIAGVPVLDFQVRLIQLGPADLPRLRALQSLVAALLMALAIRDALEAAVAAVSTMARLPGPLDDVYRFLPLALKLAKLTSDEERRFRARMQQEPHMFTLFDEIKAEGVADGLAKGKAEGKAEGVIATLRDLVAAGTLSIDTARAEIRRLIDQGVLPENMGAEAIQRLG